MFVNNFSLGVLGFLQSCLYDINNTWKPAGKPITESFTLSDLWGCYDEWSAYGAGTHVLLNNGETLDQYYVPYLSGIQLYINKPPTPLRYLTMGLLS